MSAVIYRGADFRAKSVSGLTVESPTVMETVAGSSIGAPAPINPAIGTSFAALLPYCDIRVLQDAERQAARFAEAIAVIADRACDKRLRDFLALIAESHVEEAKILKDMAAEALAGKAGKGGAA